MLCKSCDKEVQCTGQATFEVFWPGKTTVACDRHHLGMQRIAGAMGFALDSRPIERCTCTPGGGALCGYCVMIELNRG